MLVMDVCLRNSIFSATKIEERYNSPSFVLLDDDDDDGFVGSGS